MGNPRTEKRKAQRRHKRAIIERTKSKDSPTMCQCGQFPVMKGGTGLCRVCTFGTASVIPEIIEEDY